MYQDIHEEIAVVGVYQAGRFRPIKFRWRNAVHLIGDVCDQHDFKDGSVRKRRYSVFSAGTTFLLSFDRDREHWTLEQLWVEG